VANVISLASPALPRIKTPLLKPPSWLRGDWRFGFGSGSKLYDRSRYRNHGDISGAAWAAGLHGYCLDFDAALPSYVEIPATATQLNFTSEPFSIVARIYPTAFTGGRCIYERGQIAVDGYLFMLGSPGALYCYVSQAGAFQENHTGVNVLTANAWSTIGISRSGVRIRFYINGVDSTSTLNDITDPASCARTAKIAIRNDLATTPFDGLIEFLRIFSIALSASEHLGWHNALS